MSTPLLSTHTLAAGLAGKTFCRGLDLALEPGECWALLGMNGTGKTTLLHTLAGLRAPLAGEVRVEGRVLEAWSRRALAQRVGVLAQDTPDPFPARVLETALTGRHPHLGLWRAEGPTDRQRAHQTLTAVELDGLETREVTSLSGGERRRLAIATVLIQDPALYLLDEPLNHLDLRHQVRLLELFRGQVTRQGRAAVLALHDPNLALRYCDHALLLFADGTHAAGPAPALLTRDNLERLYRCPMRSIETEAGRILLPG